MLGWIGVIRNICLKPSGSDQAERFSLKQEPEAIQSWISQLRTRFGGRPVWVALEQKRGALIHALIGHEFLLLYPVNPKALARYREAFSSSGAKSDPTDAELLLRAFSPDDEQARELRMLVG